MTPEEERLYEDREHELFWKRWGPYLSERAWGTVREDYSPDGAAWDYFPFDQARSRAYRWNEDGIGGISDRHQRICFALTLWNGQDPILKERLFGVSGPQGNHGEDVKEYYYFLDNTPTHSYMKMLYKYPQAAYPYERLVRENLRRGRLEPEYELLDTGVFAQSRYFDVFIEYAKEDCEEILIQVSAVNRGLEPATLHLLPTVWFRNTWVWSGCDQRPELRALQGSVPCIELEEPKYGHRWLTFEGSPELLFTDNETNNRRLFGSPNLAPYVKDGIDDYVVRGVREAVNPERRGTKAAAHYVLSLEPGGTGTVRALLSAHLSRARKFPSAAFEKVMAERKQEADQFYSTIIPHYLSADAKSVMRQALAGLLWSKQFYHYIVKTWLEGDPAMPPPPPQRKLGRNHDWKHVYNDDVLSMPDTWEYPWYAAWDLAFHCIPISIMDPDLAKQQLTLLLREWYMHPNGQLPAYEWAFGDVNPPVHAWAALRVFRIERKRRGKGDRLWLESVFHKLMLNFTWWVNRKDAEGMNIFQGGFLGLDNIGIFDRSAPLPTGGYIEQSDGTSWMAMYTLNLLAIAMELAIEDPAYEDVASKFWEHFLHIAHAMNDLGAIGMELWDEQDGFFYDVLHLPDGTRTPMRVRSIVGLIPLFAVETLESDWVDRLPGFKKRLQWVLENRPDLTRNVASMETPGHHERRLLSIVDTDQLRSILKVMLDENEFLSPYGIRSLSRYHKDHPYSLQLDGHTYSVDYEPGESTTTLFGGNSNWRGPIWFPINYLIIESLQKYHWYLGDSFQVECPTGSGCMMNLWEVSVDLSRRLTRLFLCGPEGGRPVYGRNLTMQHDPEWVRYVQFYEYFHGDTGAGLGASHQTGWTGLAAKLLQQSGEAE